jgi:hypothetical protein
MGGGGLCGHARLGRQFGGGQGLAAHQGGQDVGAGRITDQGGNAGDVGTCFHGSMLAEALTPRNRVDRGLQPFGKECLTCSHV